MQTKSDKFEFKDFFRFTKNGKMKSGTLVYSFSFAALFLVVYGAAYYFLIDVLGPLTSGLPIIISDLIGAIVPAVIGACVLFLPLKMLSDKKPFFFGYVWIVFFAVLFLAAMSILLKDDKEALAIFLRLFVIMVPAPLIIGAGSAWYFWKKSEKEEPEENYD